MKRILFALPAFLLTACSTTAPVDEDRARDEFMAACRRAELVIAMAEPWRTHPSLSEEAKRRVDIAVQTARTVCATDMADLSHEERMIAVLTAISTIMAAITANEVL